MTRIIKYFVIAITICLQFNLIGQNRILDSLKIALKNAKHDTTRCNVLKLLSNKATIEEQSKYSEQLKSIAEKNIVAGGELKNTYLKHLSFAFNKIGYAFSNQSLYPKALEYYFKSIKLSKEADDKQGLASTMINIANVYFNQANYPLALEYYFKCLKLSEQVGDKQHIGIAFGNIANLYIMQLNYPKALEYYFKCLKLCEEFGNKQSVAIVLGNIGSGYYAQGDYHKALEYYFKALKLSEEMGDKMHAGKTIGNIGLIYEKQADYNKALEYYFKGLKLKEEVGYKQGVVISLSNIGGVYMILNKHKESELYLKKALLISIAIGAEDAEKYQHVLLSNLYERTNRPALALEHFKKFISLRDTIFSHENSKKLMRSEMNHEYEKQAAVAKAKHNAELIKQHAIADEKNRRQNIVISSVAIGLLLVIIFASYVFKTLRVTRKQKAFIEIKNKETEHQKKEIEIKQKEILDSIHYAKRIQRALIPSEKYIDRSLNKLQKRG